MDLVTIDFETFYSKEYSLRRMTTEAYIRDPRFQVIGMGIKVNGGPAEWLTEYDMISARLAHHSRTGCAMLCHNTAFDGLIAHEHFGFNPVFMLDTMSMARPKHALTIGVSLKALAEHYGLESKGTVLSATMGLRQEQFNFMQLAALGAYCKTDVELTYKLFKILNKGFPPSELKLIDQTLRMYTDPVLELNRELLSHHISTERHRKQQLLDTFGGDVSVLMSNPKFAEVLISLGVSPPVKISKTTGKETWAFSKTDKGMLALLEHSEPAVRVAAEARLGVKSSIEETRAVALAEVSDRGTLPIMLNYYGAHSGRFSGGDKLNLQNLPRGGVLRQCILSPSTDQMLVAGDSSQIEARMLAYIAGQDDLVEAFRQGRDVYSEFASDVYGRTITKADKVERFLGKTCILGLGYGMGHVRFREALALGMGGMKVAIGEREAKRIVGLYRDKNFKIASLWNEAGTMLRSMANGETGTFSALQLPFDSEHITFPNGLGLTYPNLRMDQNNFVYDSRKLPVKLFGAKAVENVVQGLARIVVTDQMLEVGKRYRVVMQVHDEIVVVAPTAIHSNAPEYIKEVMSTPPAWAPDLPVACEVACGINYGECK